MNDVDTMLDVCDIITEFVSPVTNGSLGPRIVGFDDGFDDGINDGFDDGCDVGDVGCNVGCSVGCAVGFRVGE